MKPLLLTILICLISLTAFAQEKAEDCQTKSDILRACGEPFWKGKGELREVWYYPHKSMFIFFDKEKVTMIDVLGGEEI